MRIAYLLLCHKNPQQVQRLIAQLQDTDVDFYIHVDKKAENFYGLEASNVFCVPDDQRVDVRWAAFSMVQATNNLIQQCLDSGNKYDYVFLLSGQDFPIKSNEYIKRFLRKNDGHNFIEVLPAGHPRQVRYAKRNMLFYPAWIQKQTFTAKVWKRLYILFTGGHSHTFAPLVRKNVTGLPFYFGSQWWALQGQCLEWIQEYLNAHPDFFAYYRNCLTPDESVYQTLFMASPFADSRWDMLTFLQWREDKNGPRIFRKEDLDLLMSSDKLFARKFDSEIDEIILQYISNEKNGEKNGHSAHCEY